MALVLDPVTGRMVDDGRVAAPSAARGLLAPGAAAASAAGAALGVNFQPGLPSYTGGQPGRGDLQPTYAQRTDAYETWRAGGAVNPLNQAGAITANDVAQRAVQQAGAPANIPARMPQQGLVGPAPYQPNALERAESAIQNSPTLSALANPVGAAGRGVEALTGATPGELAQSVGRVGLGGLALPVTAAVEGARNAAVRGLGGDVASLPGGGSAQSDAASALIDRGTTELGRAGRTALDNAQGFALGLLGAQRAQPAAPATPAAPTFAPGTIGAGGVTAADQAVIAQDRANLQGAVDRLNTNFDTWRVPTPSAQVAQGGGAGLMAPDMLPQRGNYTQTNTDMAALQRRSAGGNGINLGPVPTAAAAPAGERFQVIGVGDELQRLMTSDDPFERRAGRELAVMRSAESVAAGQNATELQRTRLAGELGLQETGLRGDYALQGADVQGQYGLLDRQLANEAAMYGAEAQAAGARDAALAKLQGQLALEQFKQQNNPTNLVQQGNIQMAQEMRLSGQYTPEQINAALNGRLAPQSVTPRVISGGYENLPLGLQIGDRTVLNTPEEMAALRRLITPPATR